MRCNEKGIALIKKFEGLKLEPYLCPAGIPTVGYGSVKAGKLGRNITEAEAEQFLKEDIEMCERGMKSLILNQVTDNQWSALVCLVFNIGLGNFASSTLLKHLNKNERAQAAEQFQRWVFSKGKVLPGLEKRREAEKQLFLSI
jgi:lysozyme